MLNVCDVKSVGPADVSLHLVRKGIRASTTSPGMRIWPVDSHLKSSSHLRYHPANRFTEATGLIGPYCLKSTDSSPNSATTHLTEFVGFTDVGLFYIISLNWDGFAPRDVYDIALMANPPHPCTAYNFDGPKNPGGTVDPPRRKAELLQTLQLG